MGYGGISSENHTAKMINLTKAVKNHEAFRHL
jgi:hypothetical protein